MVLAFEAVWKVWKKKSIKDSFTNAIFSCLSSEKSCLRFLLICFVRETKGFYQSSLGNEVDFKGIMNVSPNILTKN